MALASLTLATYMKKLKIVHVCWVEHAMGAGAGWLRSTRVYWCACSCCCRQNIITIEMNV